MKRKEHLWLKYARLAKRTRSKPRRVSLVNKSERYRRQSLEIGRTIRLGHDSNDVPSAATCLFTGVPLNAATKEEHTIPRGLGGRIRPRIVSCDEFNNKCGSWADKFLVDVYAETMATLGPLLSVEHRTGKLDVELPGETGRYAVDEFGGVVQKGVKVLKRDPATGRPTVVKGHDKGKLENILGASPDTKWSSEAAVTAETYRRRKRTIGSEIEFAALKSALLTFDHVLAESDRRFTREPALAEIRNFIGQTVHTRKLDGPAMRRFSLGLQYEKLPLIRELRASIAIPEKEFEHVLIASANMGTRTLDIVWLVLGIDPFGFRVSHSRRDADFTCIIVNDILREGTVRGPHWGFLPPGVSHICAPTVYRAFQSDEEMDGVDFDSVAKTIANHRMRGQARAISLVERTADTYVCDCLAEIAILDNDGDHLVTSAIRERLRRLYAHKLEQPRSLDVFDRIVSGQLANAPSERVCSDSDKPSIRWAPWLVRYRAALSELTREIGIPGEGFASDPGGGIDEADDRLLGKPPGPTTT